MKQSTKKTKKQKQIERVFNWTERHPSIDAVYMNPADVPEEHKAGLWGQTNIGGCLILFDKEVPASQFWPVPSEHSHNLDLCQRRMSRLRAIHEAIAVLLDEYPLSELRPPNKRK